MSLASDAILPKSCDVAIVGAGAAGLATAIAAGRNSRSRSIVVLERARKPGAKILVSGGGRCNVTNAVVTDTDFWGGPRTIVRKVLRAFTVHDTVRLFHDAGVALHEEAGGKLFPDTNRSRDVLDALLRETARAGALVAADRHVLAVERSSSGFHVITTAGALTARAVVLAAGGQSLPKSGSDGTGFKIAEQLGHSIVPVTPALAPLVLDDGDSVHPELRGVSHDVELMVRVDDAIAIRLTGALLWTHFGISGPAVLNASRHWLRARLERRRVSLAANMCPGREFDHVDLEWRDLSRTHPKATTQSTLAEAIPSSVASAVLRRIGVPADRELAHLSRDDRRRIVRALVDWPLPVVDSRGYTYAEATAGGVTLSEIDPATMESRICKGLWLVGEMLDVDGRIGGFNFQWAWSSGFVAGRAIARR